MLLPNHAGDDVVICDDDSTAELCHEGAAESSIVTSPDSHMAIYMLNDSSSSPMTRTRRIQKITRTCMKHHNEASH
jgi:hypothetical protein